MEQIGFQFEPQRRLYTVGELNAAIRDALDREFSDIWVSGEISGVKQANSGHCYFTLKERDSQIRCVLFRNTARFLRFRPQDGIAVLARGRIDVYDARGEYQFLVDMLEPQGHGRLQFAFEQLKRKLAMEGLFDAARKRPLPKLPSRIGIISSPSGAVIQDMLRILERRFAGLHIRLYPAMVQGDGSAEQVCRGLDYFGSSNWADVVILARGGGSLEDLWTFNEEVVARAIERSPVPVISAIGHETDFTIADFVADLRAPTPSAAAELVICTQQELLERIAGCAHRARQAVRYRLGMAARRLHERGVERASAIVHRQIGRAQQRTDEFEFRLRHRVRDILGEARRRWQGDARNIERLDLRLRLARTRHRLESAEFRAIESIARRTARSRARLEPLEAQLFQLSPLRVLERGYAIVQNESGEIVKRPDDAPAGSSIRIKLAEGGLKASVTDREDPTPGGS
jgi:exodeoxyribonuclease VII large subunit